MNRKYFVSCFDLLVCLCQSAHGSSCERICSQLADVGSGIIGSLCPDPGCEIFSASGAVDAELMATSVTPALRNKTEIIRSENGYLFVKFKTRKV